jgi:hydroxymethylbilane synthase
VLGLEVRRDDHETIQLLDFLNHQDTRTAVTAERAFSEDPRRGLPGTHRRVFAQVDEETLSFEGPGGGTGRFQNLQGKGHRKSRDEAEAIGIKVANALWLPAGDVLKRLYDVRNKVQGIRYSVPGR